MPDSDSLNIVKQAADGIKIKVYFVTDEDFKNFIKTKGDIYTEINYNPSADQVYFHIRYRGAAKPTIHNAHHPTNHFQPQNGRIWTWMFTEHMQP